MHRDSQSPTVAVELWYRAPGAGYDNANPGISRLALTALAASAPPHGTSVADLVTRVGGTLTVNVYPDIAMIGVSVPSFQADALIRALTGAYFHGAVSDAGLKAALRDCAIAAAEAHFDAERLLQDALFARIFSEGPQHYPATPQIASDFTKISIGDIKTFAARAFRSQNAFLTVTGSVSANWASNVAAGSDAQPDAPIDSTLSGANIDATESAQIAGFGTAWIGPPISDARSATAMDFIADYLFDPDHGTLPVLLRKSQNGAFVNGQFITLHDPGVLLVTVSGTGAQGLRSQVLDAVKTVQQPLDAKTFEAARKAFMYHILSQTQTPSSRADNLGWYAAEGNAPYAPGERSGQYIQAAESLDPGFIAAIARKYLQHPAIVQLLAAPHGSGTSA